MDLWLRIQEITESRLHYYEGEVALNKMEQVMTMLGDQSQTVSYKLQLSRSGEYLFIKGAVAGELTFNCDRCLEPFQYFQQEQFQLTLLPTEPQNKLAKDLVLSLGELERATYEGEWLDILKILEEQVLLGIPMKKICFENCQGLCSQCGTNLKGQECVCSPVDNSDHPFAGLIQ